MQSRFSFSAIAAGAALALAFQAASAQSLVNEVTVNQQGNGNTAYTDQSNSDPAFGNMRVQITQIGNDNHVGGPGGLGGGVVQQENLGVEAVIRQTGTGNNAGVTQTGNFGPVFPGTVAITQTGSDNIAMLRQYDSSDITANVEQRGTGDVAGINHTGATAQLATSQVGTDNRISIDYANGPYGGPRVTQTGEGNSATVFGYGVELGGGVNIEQTGSFNSATTTQSSLVQSSHQIRQQGTGNQADTAQSGDVQILSIDQNGNDNRASISQTGVSAGAFGNSYVALIAQLGNSNTAIVRQVGENYVAKVSQTGSGNYTNIYQH